MSLPDACRGAARMDKPMLQRLKKTLGLQADAPSLPPEDRPESQDNAPKPSVADVTDEDFAAMVEASDRLVVVDFWAEWCEPCHTMSAYVGFLSMDYADELLVAALDVDENPETPPRFNIMGLPTLLFLRNGVEVGRQVGIVPYEALQKSVEELLHQP